MPEVVTTVKRCRFDQIAKQINDRVDNPAESGVERYVGLEHLDTNSLRIRRWGDVTDVASTKLRFQPGDIIFGKRRVYQRKLAVADFEGICSAHAMVLRARPEVALPEFLSFFMQSDHFMERALEISVGSLSPTINWKTLAAEEFALPPIDEQRRLALLLSAAESGIDALRALLDSIRELRQSSIDHLTALAQRGEPLGDHCKMQNGRSFPGSDYCDDGVLLLRPGNLSASGYLDWAPAKTKRVPERYLIEASDFVVGPGDVLINLTAQSLEDGFMGRVCLARDGQPSLLNQRIGRFVSFSDRVLPEFLYRTLQSSRFQSHAVSMCEGSKVKHLFWEHLARFQMHIPKAREQETIVAVLRAIDDRLSEAHNRVFGARGLKKQLLATLAGATRDAQE